VNQVVISQDDMANVFDYDPLVMEIERIAVTGHYKTQERLITLIASACAAYPAVQRIEITLKKSPVRLGGGSLGIQLSLDAIATNALRHDKTKTTV
jgi:dihydroneopterin aldolase